MRPAHIKGLMEPNLFNLLLVTGYWGRTSTRGTEPQNTRTTEPLSEDGKTEEAVGEKDGGKKAKNIFDTDFTEYTDSILF